MRWGKSCFQSQHASILEHDVTAQQSFISSHESSMQVNTPPRRARMAEDIVATVRARLGMCAMVSVLCKQDVPEIDWEKLVKAGHEPEVKPMLEFEMCEEVSEELTSGKRIWNSAWLDSQEKSGVARSAPAENQISGAWQCDDVVAGKRKIMRKDETTGKLLKAVHGTQVASLRWPRLARGTCEDRWKVPISVPCVGYNETRDSLVVFHGDVTTILSTTAGALMHGGHWLVMWSVMREVRDLSSCVSECHGKESGAVRDPLMNYICRKEKEQMETRAVASRMEQRLGARKHCHVVVKWLWLRQATDEIELWNDVMWILMNLMGMKLVAGEECLVQQERGKITGTMIPDRDVDHEKRNCQRGFESLETIDGVRVAGHELMIIDPMKWRGPGPSRQ